MLFQHIARFQPYFWLSLIYFNRTCFYSCMLGTAAPVASDILVWERHWTSVCIQKSLPPLAQGVPLPLLFLHTPSPICSQGSPPRKNTLWSRGGRRGSLTAQVGVWIYSHRINESCTFDQLCLISLIRPKSSAGKLYLYCTVFVLPNSGFHIF